MASLNKLKAGQGAPLAGPGSVVAIQAIQPPPLTNAQQVTTDMAKPAFVVFSMGAMQLGARANHLAQFKREGYRLVAVDNDIAYLEVA